MRWLKRAMPFSEFLGWCEWIKRYPIDDESNAAYMAQLACIYVNAHLPKNVKPKSILDFMIFRPSEPLSMDEKWRRLLRGASAAHEAQSRKKRKN